MGLPVGTRRKLQVLQIDYTVRQKSFFYAEHFYLGRFLPILMGDGLFGNVGKPLCAQMREDDMKPTPHSRHKDPARTDQRRDFVEPGCHGRTPLIITAGLDLMQRRAVIVKNPLPAGIR